MNLALIVIIVIAVILAIVGSVTDGLIFLLYVGIAIGLIALIAFLLRVLRRNT